MLQNYLTMMSALVGRGRQNYNPEASTARRSAPGGLIPDGENH
jgi:hypothetical protein